MWTKSTYRILGLAEASHGISTHMDHISKTYQMHSDRWIRILIFYLLRSSRYAPSNPFSNNIQKNCTCELGRYTTITCTYEVLFQGQH